METNHDYNVFMEELAQILEDFERNSNPFVLFGDFNIDLLKISEKPKSNEFL